jgi:hypothetical protein
MWPYLDPTKLLDQTTPRQQPKREGATQTNKQLPQSPFSGYFSNQKIVHYESYPST